MGVPLNHPSQKDFPQQAIRSWDPHSWTTHMYTYIHTDEGWELASYCCRNNAFHLEYIIWYQLIFTNTTIKKDSLQDMEVSWNRGTPKSSILIGISIINEAFRGTPIYGSPIWSMAVWGRSSSRFRHGLRYNQHGDETTLGQGGCIIQLFFLVNLLIIVFVRHLCNNGLLNFWAASCQEIHTFIPS